MATPSTQTWSDLAATLRTDLNTYSNNSAAVTATQDEISKAQALLATEQTSLTASATQVNGDIDALVTALQSLKIT